MDKLVMSKDRIVAKFDAMNHLVWKDEHLCPLYFKRTENLNGWLACRAIDSHRPNSRLLKKALRLAERDDVSTVLSVHAVTVTDTYWVKDADSSLTWNNVRFQKDYFSTLALKGDYNSFTSANKSGKTHTQELTNIGSFEKCWRLKGTACGGSTSRRMHRNCSPSISSACWENAWALIWLSMSLAATMSGPGQGQSAHGILLMVQASILSRWTQSWAKMWRTTFTPMMSLSNSVRMSQAIMYPFSL